MPEVQKHVKVVVVRSGKKSKVENVGATSWALPARLTEQGVETAKQVAQRLREVLQGCTLFACSPLIRAQETLFAVMEELGFRPRDLEKFATIDYTLWSTKPEIWYLNGDPDKYTNAAVYEERSFDVERDGMVVLSSIQSWAKCARSQGMEVVMCISNGGPLDSAIMLAKRYMQQDTTIGDLREGEGAIFYFDENSYLAGVEDFLQS